MFLVTPPTEFKRKFTYFTSKKFVIFDFRVKRDITTKHYVQHEYVLAWVIYIWIKKL